MNYKYKYFKEVELYSHLDSFELKKNDYINLNELFHLENESRENSCKLTYEQFFYNLHESYHIYRSENIKILNDKLIIVEDLQKAFLLNDCIIIKSLNDYQANVFGNLIIIYNNLLICLWKDDFFDFEYDVELDQNNLLIINFYGNNESFLLDTISSTENICLLNINNSFSIIYGNQTKIEFDCIVELNKNSFQNNYEFEVKNEIFGIQNEKNEIFFEVNKKYQL